eukprot:MONOS_11895.1-p1 / transcript=MONOS_11895.1 / gene=MONOS_11895 / organism=Monocercomonoides_exilis_PA203 / gene_product=unspecified product / transcript_product=unspecified product / location=Mono_scaffold00622:23120-23867(+) / protein_length=193 / sequence_SO=supercontig / SO=protein_coding / is_pseudo=false
MIVIGLCTLIYFLAFKISASTMKFYKVAKIIETIAASIYSLWVLIFHVIAGSTYHQFYHFAHAIDIVMVFVYLSGAVTTTLGITLSRKRLLIGQVLMVAYVGVEFIILLAMFLGEFTTPFLRVMDIILYLIMTFSTGLASFVTYEVYRRLTNEIGGRKGFNKGSQFVDAPTSGPSSISTSAASSSDDHSAFY